MLWWSMVVSAAAQTCDGWSTEMDRTPFAALPTQTYDGLYNFTGGEWTELGGVLYWPMVMVSSTFPGVDGIAYNATVLRPVTPSTAVRIDFVGISMDNPVTVHLDDGSARTFRPLVEAFVQDWSPWPGAVDDCSLAGGCPSFFAFCSSGARIVEVEVAGVYLDNVAFGDLAPAPVGLSLTTDQLVVGRNTVRVAGAQPGETVWVAASPRPATPAYNQGQEQPGTCLQPLGGQCLELNVQPNVPDQAIGRAVAGPDGVASVRLQLIDAWFDGYLPPGPGWTPIVLQAAVRRGPQGADSVTSRPVFGSLYQ